MKNVDYLPLIIIKLLSLVFYDHQWALTFHLSTIELNLASTVAQWSRGMIPALGAGGPGFKSRLSPCILLTQTDAGDKN